MYENINIPVSVKEQFDISGRVAIITGGGGFLGLQFSEAISEMGGIPILIDNNRDLLQKNEAKLDQFGCKQYNSYISDVTDEKSCINTIDQINSDFSRIDILINCAALTKSGIEDKNKEYFTSFEKLDQKLWDAGLKINLTGTQIMCKLVGTYMANKGKGSIINIASEIGIISPDQRIYQSDDSGYKGVNFNSPAFYAVSKAGVIHLTKFLSTIWAEKNVRVNSISPTGVYRHHDPGFVKKLSQCIPMGRMALPNEFKGAIAYLSSDASSFVTGHNLIIDGGRTIW